MSVALAEQPTKTETWQSVQAVFPEIMAESRRDLERYVGAQAIRGEVELNLIEQPNNTTLLADAQNATLGDKAADLRVQTLVFTDVAERTNKWGHFTEVPVKMGDSGLEQDGRTLLDVHKNNLRFSQLNREMREKSIFEGTNVVAFKELFKQGLLQDHDALVISPASTRMTQQEKADFGMFVETDSCSLQLLSMDGPSGVLQTAMVAGKTSPEAPRHDMAAIKKMLENQGIPFDVTDGTEAVSYIVLIPKTQLPDGIVSVVKMYDEAVGGVFYGMPHQGQDYAEHAALCRQRNANMTGLVARIKQEFLANIHQATSELDAVHMLDALSDEFSVEQAALVDHSIDARVFGPGAYHIEEARRLQLLGDMAGAEAEVRKSQAVSQSSSCPLFKGAGAENEGQGGGQREESSKKKFMKCPFCSARVWGDPCAKQITCTDCRASVSNGRVTSKGDGGHKVRAAKKEADAEIARQKSLELHRKEQEAALGAQVDEALAARGWDAGRFAAAQAMPKAGVAASN